MRELSCKDAGYSCDFVASGNTDDEVMKKVAEHGKKVHGMKDSDFTADKVTKYRKLIHESGSPLRR